RAATVRAAAAVAVDDDFSTGQTGVTVRTAHHEFSGGVDVEDDVGVPILFRNHRTHDLLDDLSLGRFGELIVAVEHAGVVLRRDDNGVHPHRLFVLVFDRDLALAVWTQKRQRT